MKGAIKTILLLMPLLLSACSSYSLVERTPGETNGSAAGAKVTIQFWHTFSDVETKVFDESVLPLFEREHPDIEVHAVRQNYTSQLNDNIVAAVADDKQPDVMRMDIVWLPQFAQSGALTDLSVMSDFADYKTRFTGSLIRTNLYEGRYYGLPLDATTMLPIYNKALLKQAGLAEPPRTMDELAEAAARLKQQNAGLYGISICCSSAWGMLPYFWTLGGQLLDSDYTRASGYLDSPASMAAMTKLKGWLDSGIMSPTVIGGEPGGWDGLFNGKILMIDEAHWFFTANDNSDYGPQLDNMVTGLFPSDVREGTSIIGGENLVLFKGSKHPQEAWTFMKFMVSKPVQEQLAETGLIPSISDFDQSKLAPRFRMYVDQLRHAEPRPLVPQWNAVDDAFSRMVTRILVGEKPLEDAMRETAKQIDGILAAG